MGNWTMGIEGDQAILMGVLFERKINEGNILDWF